MGFAVEGQSGGLHSFPHEAAEAIDREGLTEFRIDDRHMRPRGCVECLPQDVVQPYIDGDAGLVAGLPDATGINLSPGHPVNIDSRSSDTKHERICGALFRAQRPSPFECRHFCVGPSPDWPRLRPSTDRLQPADVDRVADQNSKLLECVQRCAGPIGIGL